MTVLTGRVYLDCCALLNLYATGRFQEILSANGTSVTPSFAVAQRVTTEAMYVRNVQPTEGQGDREQVDLQDSIAAGILSVEHLSSDAEAETFVKLAATLDDGEAETGALAYHRSGSVATDDVAAIRALNGIVPPVAILRTSHLLKGWADRGNPPTATVRQALSDIRDRARFVPGATDPLRDWWSRLAA
jgi:hypothetical protein